MLKEFDNLVHKNENFVLVFNDGLEMREYYLILCHFYFFSLVMFLKKKSSNRFYNMANIAILKPHNPCDIIQSK